MLLSLSALALAAALRLPAPPAPATLSGHLAHAPAGDSVQLSYGRHYGPQSVKAALSAAGDFNVTLTDLKVGTPIMFTYVGQRTSLFLSPGDQARLTIDFPRFDETQHFTGQGANENNYLAQSLWKFEFSPARAAPQGTTKAMPTLAQLRQEADANRKARHQFLTAYAKAHPLPADFQRNFALDIDLNWAANLLLYSSFFRTIPAAYFNFLQRLPLKKFDQYLGDRGLNGNMVVMNLLTSYSYRLVPSGKLGTDPAAGRRHYAQAQADFGPSKASIDRAMYQLYRWKLEDDLDGVVAAYPTFRLHNHDSTFARDLRTLIGRQITVQVGRPAPAFTLLDNTGKPVSLADLRGKIVYLDFWGTWCGPCMMEMPASIELKQKFAGRDVAFVFISVRDAETKWQQVLAAEHLISPNSVHLRSPEHDDVASRYQVTGYPTFWLIGCDGHIITRAAPRPSQGPQAEAAIEQALAR